ncbi:MAG: phosphate butyryltransferase [bacterium]|jgi:phosphate butyryltransferase
MIRTLDGVLLAARDLPASRIAVAGADDPMVIDAVRLAEDEGLGRALLFGNPEAIGVALENASSPPQWSEIVASDDPCAAAVDAVKSGAADSVLKGNVPTNTLLKAVLRRDAGEGGVERLLSHVAIIENYSQNRLLICTDGGMVTDPDVSKKAAILDNAIQVARSLGLECPRIGLPALMEDKGQNISSLNDARKLMEMYKAGRWPDTIMDGPFGVDVFLDEESARHKGISSPCAGAVDILLFPNTDSCNIAVKMVLHYCHMDMIGLVVGGITPVILVSRAHSSRAKLISIALAKIVKRGAAQASSEVRQAESAG